MNEDRISVIANNEKEWRKHILRELSEVKKSQSDMLITVTTLKIKFGMIGGVFGTIGGFLGTILIKVFFDK